MSGRLGEARQSFRTVLLLMAIPLAGLAIFFFWNWLHDGITPREAADDVVTATRSVRAGLPPANAGGATLSPEQSAPSESEPSRQTPSVPPRQAVSAPAASSGAGIVLIIDDLGFDGQPLERVMALDPNISCSVLPNGPRARETAELLHARGFEVLCHLPMEPRRSGVSPGRGAVLTSMDDGEIAEVTRRNVEAIPFARGVNNHMGSRATADRRVMEGVLRALPAGMFFVDSKTSGSSLGLTIARELGIPAAGRHVFLDDDASEDAIRRQLAQLATLADRHGLAIGIGHPYAATMRVLSEELPQLRSRGYRIVRASEAVR